MNIFKLLFNAKTSKDELDYLVGVKSMLKIAKTPSEKVEIAIRAFEYIRDNLRTKNWKTMKSTGLSVLYNNVVNAQSLKEQVGALSNDKLVGWGTAWDSDLRGFFKNLHVDDNTPPVNLKNKSEKQPNLEQIKKEDDKIKLLKDENRTYLRELEELRQKLEKLNTQSPQYQKEINQLNKKIKTMQEDIYNERKKYKNAELQLKEEKKNLLSQIQATKQKELNDTQLKNEIAQFKQEKEAYDKNLKVLEQNKKVMDKDRESLDSLKQQLEDKQRLLENRLKEVENDKSTYEREKLKLEEEKREFKDQKNTPFPWEKLMELIADKNPDESSNDLALADAIDDFFRTQLTLGYRITETILKLYENLKTAKSIYLKFKILSDFDFKSAGAWSEGNMLNAFFKQRCEYIKKLKGRAEIIIERGSVINSDDVETLNEYLYYIDPDEQKSTYLKCSKILDKVNNTCLAPSGRNKYYEKLSAINQNTSTICHYIVSDVHRTGMKSDELARILLKHKKISGFIYSNASYFDRGNQKQKLRVTINSKVEKEGQFFLRNNSDQIVLLLERKDFEEKYEPLLGDKIFYNGPSLIIYEIPYTQALIKSQTVKSTYNDPKMDVRTVLEILDANCVRNQDEFEVLTNYLKHHFKNWDATCDECLTLLKRYDRENSVVESSFKNMFKTMSKLNMIWDDLGYILYFTDYSDSLDLNNTNPGTERIYDVNRNVEINVTTSEELRYDQKLLFEYKGYKVIENPIWTEFSTVPTTTEKTKFDAAIAEHSDVFNTLKNNGVLTKDAVGNALGWLYPQNNYIAGVEYPPLEEVLAKFDEELVTKTFFSKLTDKNGKKIPNKYYLFQFYSPKDTKKLKRYLWGLHFLELNDSAKFCDIFKELAGMQEFQLSGNSSYKGTKTIDGLLRRAKSLLDDLREFYNNSHGLGCVAICLANIGKIKKGIYSKSEFKLNPNKKAQVPQYYRPLTYNSNNLNEVIKADLYALGICFIEMLLKCDLSQYYGKGVSITAHNNHNYEIVEFFISIFRLNNEFLADFIDPTRNRTSLFDSMRQKWCLYDMYKTSEATKIRNFADMIHDMLNYRFDISHCSNRLDKISENRDDASLKIKFEKFYDKLKGTNVQPFNYRLATLKSSFKSTLKKTDNYDDKELLLLNTLKAFGGLFAKFVSGNKDLATFNDKTLRNFFDQYVIDFPDIPTVLDEKLYKNIRDWLLLHEIARNKNTLEFRDTYNVFPTVKKFLESMLGYIKVLLVSKNQKNEIVTLNDQKIKINFEGDQNKYWSSAVGKKFCLIKNGKPSLNENEIQQGSIGDCWLEATLRSMVDTDAFNFERTFVNYAQELEKFTDPNTNQEYYIVKKDTKALTVRLYKVVVSCHLKLRGRVLYNNIYARPTGKYMDLKINPTYLALVDGGEGRTAVGNKRSDFALWVNFIEKAVTIGRVQPDLVTVDKESRSDTGYLPNFLKNWKTDPDTLSWKTLNGSREDGICYSILTGKNAKGETKNTADTLQENAAYLFAYIDAKMQKGERLTTDLYYTQINDKPYHVSGHSASESIFYLNGNKNSVFVINHEYSISKLENVNNQRIITLKNPWGDKQREQNEGITGFDTLEMTLEDFCLRYSSISKGKV